MKKEEKKGREKKRRLVGNKLGGTAITTDQDDRVVQIRHVQNTVCVLGGGQPRWVE